MDSEQVSDVDNYEFLNQEFYLIWKIIIYESKQIRQLDQIIP